MELVVKVEQGLVQGREQDGVASFKGIPYAAAPFGSRRFGEPAPAPAWPDVRDAGSYGPTAPKPGYPSPIDKILPEPVIEGDDCLNLNVWTPDTESTGLPVLVWIHGGAFVNGGGAIYDGAAFARDGVVCVTINYRLGAEGFLLVDGVPANRGLLDQVAALEWVRANIASFGGNPDAVTIAGESAGAMSVGTLMSMPRAAGLFRRAILQSGAGHHVISAATAGKVATALAEQLTIEPTAAAFGAVPVDDLVAAQAALSARIAKQPDPKLWGEIAVNMMAWEPSIDGDVVPEKPIDAIVAGAGSDIDILIGSNSDEHALFLVPAGIVDYVNEDVLKMALSTVSSDPDRVADVYRSADPDATPGQLMISAMSDWFFRIPAVRVAEARASAPGKTFVYEFGWKSPGYDGRLGACHALEIPFTFDNLNQPGNTPLVGTNPPQIIADTMHRAWVDFIASGDPGWPGYGDARTVMHFDESSEVVTDPGSEQRLVWEGVR